MENLTPAELLRFLEEEASTLRLMNGKIAHQIHCLQVEEELFSRRLASVEKPTSSALAIEFGQIEQNGKKGALDTEGDSQNRILSGEVAVRSTARVGSPEQALGSSATLLLSPGTQNRSAGDVQEPNESGEIVNDHEVELQGQRLEQEALRVRETQPLDGVQEPNESVEVGNDGQQQEQEALQVRETPLLDGVQEPSESVEVGNDHEVELQGQQQEQEPLQVRETPLLDQVQKPNESAEVGNDHEAQLQGQQQEREALRVRETPLLDPVQEPNECVEVGNGHEVDLQGQRQEQEAQEQEALQVREIPLLDRVQGPNESIEAGNDRKVELQGRRQQQEASQVRDAPQRASSRRISRRPARFLD